MPALTAPQDYDNPENPSWLKDIPEEEASSTPFPTEHPLTSPDPVTGEVSNVMTITVESDGKHFVIPSMVGGEQLSNDEAWDIAVEQGLEKYPVFDTAEEALEASINLHDKQPPPSSEEPSEETLYNFDNPEASWLEDIPSQEVIRSLSLSEGAPEGVPEEGAEPSPESTLPQFTSEEYMTTLMEYIQNSDLPEKDLPDEILNEMIRQLMSPQLGPEHPEVVGGFQVLPPAVAAETMGAEIYGTDEQDGLAKQISSLGGLGMFGAAPFNPNASASEIGQNNQFMEDIATELDITIEYPEDTIEGTQHWSDGKWMKDGVEIGHHPAALSRELLKLPNEERARISDRYGLNIPYVVA